MRAARRQATLPLPDAPLAGVPFLIKDITYLQGLPSTSGSRLFADFVPDHDSEIVARYRAAGLLIFGKTNTPEFGLNCTTEPTLFGADAQSVESRQNDGRVERRRRRRGRRRCHSGGSRDRRRRVDPHSRRRVADSSA